MTCSWCWRSWTSTKPIWERSNRQLAIVDGGVGLTCKQLVAFAECCIYFRLPIRQGHEVWYVVVHDGVFIVLAKRQCLGRVNIKEIKVDSCFGPAEVGFEEVINYRFVPRNIGLGVQVRMMKTQSMTKLMKQCALKIEVGPVLLRCTGSEGQRGC